jgi:hypothetical protein
MLININEFTEESIYDIIIYFFILIGLLYTIKEKRIPEKYALILAFCTFKIIANYRKCTFSKLECKLRKVKREDGLLSSFLDRVVDLRYSKYIYILYIIAFILLLHTENLKENLKEKLGFFK